MEFWQKNKDDQLQLERGLMEACCRYADDFVVIVKVTKAHAKAIHDECRPFLEQTLKLTRVCLSGTQNHS